MDSPNMSDRPLAHDAAQDLARWDKANPDTPAAALDTNEPLSPWAEHFGLRGHEPNFFGPTHTWIAPREPPVDPAPAGKASSIATYDVKGQLKAREYDALFLSERLQVSRFKGLRTREAQVLSQVDAYQLPDEEPWFDNPLQKSMIEVKEQGHLPIFKKARWFNNNSPMKNTIDSVHGEETPDKQGWSVDYDPLWKELRLCIELADRILKHSFKGGWMQALLTRLDLMVPFQQHAEGMTRTVHRFEIRRPFVMPRGNTPEPAYHSDSDDDPLTGFDKNVDLNRIEREAKEAKPDDKGKEKEPAPPPWYRKPEPPKPPAPNLLYAPPGWLDDVDGCHWALEEVSKVVYWTFFDDKTDPRPAEANKASLHYASGLEWDSRFCVVSLSVDCLRPLLDEDGSPVERILAINMLAITMIRGVMDAIRFWLKRTHGIEAPTFEKENVVDLQSSFENAVFGGKINFPLHQDIAKTRKGNALILTGSDFPTIGDFGVKWLPHADLVAKYHTLDTPQKEMPFRTSWHSYPIPAMWCANLLRNDFWEGRVNKLSNESLFFPKSFRAKERRIDGWGSSHLETRTYSAYYKRMFKEKDGLAELNELLVSKRNETMAERPWYWDSYYRWQVTPFSMPITRSYLNEINRWMLMPNDWNKFRVQEVVNFWQAKIPSFNGSPLAWFYSGVADLVAASLPCSWVTRIIPGGHKEWEEGAFSHIDGSNASNPVHLREVREALSRGFTKKKRFELLKRTQLERKEHFIRAWNKFDFYFHNRPYQKAMWTSLKATMRHIWTNLDNPSHEGRSWRFGLTQYQDDLLGTNWEHPETRKAVYTGAQRAKPEFRNIGGVKVRPQMLAQFAASVADAKENLMDELPAFLQASHFEDHIDEPRDEPGYHPSHAPGYALRAIGFRAQTERPVPEFEYIPAGIIADHASLKDLWLIEDEGVELAIYDVSEACKRTRMTLEDLQEAVYMTEYGFRVKRGIEWSLPRNLTKKVGYVLRWMHEELVAENDGRDGRPLWITIGLDVFNITNFDFCGNDEWETALKSNPGGNPTAAILSDKKLRSWFSDIVGHLKPWRCGRLRENRTPATSEILFTADEVAWYEFPGTGMYAIINGGVYDLTDYVESHPGGTKCLVDCAGRDVSEYFKRYHGDQCDSILESYQHLRIGRVIDTRSSSQPLEKNEFQFDSHIYRLPPIPALLDKFGGKDIEELMRGESEEEREFEGSVSATWMRGDLCVKLTQPKNCVARREVKTPLRRMDARELEKCDGHEEDDWYNEGYVAIGEDVYNVTTIVQHAPQDRAVLVGCFLGGQVTDPTVADWLRTRYPSRIVAKLTDSRVFEDVDGLRSGMLSDGSHVLRKPKWNDSFSVLDEAFPDVPHVPRDTQGRNDDDERGRTPRRALKRTRTPSPAHASKLRVLTDGQTRRLVDGETRRLAHDVRSMGDLAPMLAFPRDLPSSSGPILGMQAVMRRIREEGLRMGLEVAMAVI